MPKAIRVSVLVSALLALALPAGAGATSWSSVPTGTTSTITAVEYQSPTRFWFTTANGEIFGKGAGGNFVKQRAASSIPLNDIEFLPAPSEVGLAVGDGGQVLRTINGGASWAAVSSIPVSKKASESAFPNCTASAPLGDVNSVRFAGPNTVWLMAEGSQLARSTSGSPANVGATGTWVDANRSGSNTCKVDGGVYAEGFGDAFFAPTNPNVGYFCAGSFHTAFSTADNLATAATKRGSCGNGDGDNVRLAGDPGNPARMWAVSAGPYGVSMTAQTTDGWGNARPFDLVNIEAGSFTESTDIAYSGGTLLVAGAGGMILGSVDGSNFYFENAAPPLSSTSWEAASLAGPNDGAVGGAGGILAVSADASAVVPASGGSGGGGSGQSGAIQQPGTPLSAKDKKPPVTTIVTKPKRKSTKRKVKFTFVSSEAGSSFQCKLDIAKHFTPCLSPFKKKVTPGVHTFSVRAVDAAGNPDATPATWSFEVKKPHGSKK
jgi:photosystem II stability/assembly factor-like uncharacterized protein